MTYSVNGPVPREYVAEIRGHRITGPSPRHVIDRWGRTLEAEGARLVPGWDDEVWQALAKSHPRHIKRVPGSKAPGVGLASALSFVKFALKRVTDQSLVAPLEAHRRAAACSACPLAQPVLGCGVCKDVLQLTIHPPESVTAPPACGACGCFLPLKVWLPREQLGSADAFPFDAACWMREAPSSPDDCLAQTSG